MRAERIIVSRTDHIGDVVLTFPMLGLIKRRLPDSRIVFLGRSYTEAVIDACEYVDEFLGWDEVEKGRKKEQVDFLADQAADAIIHVYPEPAIARAAWRARIPSRIGTSHRFYHLWTCNQRVAFTRRGSDLHEAQLNSRLLEPLGIKSIPSLAEIPELYRLTRLARPTAELASLLSASKLNVIIHPMTAGNAKAWSLGNYAALVDSIPADKCQFFVTGIDDDRAFIESGLPMEETKVTSLVGRTSLTDLLGLISMADAMVCASTGPLHVAAALGKCAIGIYQPRGIGRPGRYGPVGQNAHALVHDPSCDKCLSNQECDCLQDIPVSAIRGILEPLADAKVRGQRVP